MKRITRRLAIGGGLTGAASPAVAGLFHRNTAGGVAAPPGQTITGVILSNSTFIAGAGSANEFIGTITVNLSPSSPPFSGSIALAPINDYLSFAMSGANLDVGSSDVAVATYHVSVIPIGAYIGSGTTYALPTLNGISGGGGLLVVNQSVTRPRGDLYIGDPVGPFPIVYGKAPFANSTIIATITGGPGQPSDFLAWAITGDPDGTHYNEQLVPGANATVTMLAPQGLWFNGGSVLAWNLSPGDNTLSNVRNGVGAFELRFYNGVTNAVLARHACTIDVLDRTNPFFPGLSHFRSSTPQPISLSLEFLAGVTGGSGFCPIISGSTQFAVFQIQDSGGTFIPPTANTLLLQYTVDDIPIGAPVLGPVTGGVAYTFPLTVNTTSVSWNSGTGIPDGTHALGCRVIDYVGGTTTGGTAPYCWRTAQQPFIVKNSAFVTGSQIIPIPDVGAGPGNRYNSGALDFVTFPGMSALPLHNTTTPIPTPQSGFIPPITSVLSPLFSAGPTAGLDDTNWQSDPLCGVMLQEYTYQTRFFSAILGGVWAYPIYTEGSNSLDGSYPLGVTAQFPDGGRNDTQIHQISSIIEGTDGSGQTFWLVFGIDGRIARLNYDGSTVTLAGFQYNRNVLPFYKSDVEGNETLLDTAYNVIGTFGSGVSDLRGMNDGCYDPRDATHNTIFVAKTIDHCIVKITNLLSGSPTISLYAGQEGTSGFADGAAITTARFSEPYSVACADGSGPDPAGTLYVADNGNNRLRKIDPTGTTVSTLFGNQSNLGVVGSGESTLPFTVTVTALSWSGGFLMVTTATATTPGTGQGFSANYPMQPNWVGRLNGTGNGSIDGFAQIVANIIDSTHFTIAMSVNPGALTPGTWTMYFDDFMAPLYTVPWNAGLANEAYFVSPQRLEWSSNNPGGGSATKHLMVVFSWTQSVADIDLSAQTIRGIGVNIATVAHTRFSTQPSGANNNRIFVQAPVGWVQADIDNVGTCGPQNDIIIEQATASIQNGVWRVSWDGNRTASWGLQQSFFPWYYRQQGPTGHYPWLIAFSRTQGRIASSGISDVGVWGLRIFNSAYDIRADDNPPGTNIDTETIERGFTIWSEGAVQDTILGGSFPGMFPWGSRPTMWLLRGTYGYNMLYGSGIKSVDELNGLYPTDAALAAFIQSGFGGSIPRPEITGDDLADLIYFIRRTSLSGNFTLPTPIRAPYATDVTAPVITVGPTCTRQSATTIRVQWTTDKVTYGMAFCGYASTHGQTTNVSGSIYHQWEWESYLGTGSASYRTSHDVTLGATLPLKSGVTTYIRVLSKDLAGNNVYSAEQTVT